MNWINEQNEPPGEVRTGGGAGLTALPDGQNKLEVL